MVTLDNEFRVQVNDKNIYKEGYSRKEKFNFLEGGV